MLIARRSTPPARRRPENADSSTFTSLQEPTLRARTLVNFPSPRLAGAIRVIPSNADSSYIVHKLEGTAGIVGARMRALQKQFFIPICLVLMVDILFLLFGMETAGWWSTPGTWALAFLVGIGIFVCDCYTITWVGLWQGLTARSTIQGFLRTLILVLARPWIVYMVIVALAGVALGAGLWAIGLWFLICIANCFWLCHSSSRKLENLFRMAASTA